MDPVAASQLIKQVTVKASGVFLWVYLVTQSLLEGLSDGEHLRDLQSRVESLPEDIEKLFGRMIDSLDPKRFANVHSFSRLCVGMGIL